MTSVRWFVSHDLDGTVSHLVRITESASAVYGEFLRDGEWHEDASVLSYLLDPTLGSEITAEEGEQLAVEHGAGEVPTFRSAPIAAAFAGYFDFAGLELPDPIPVVGLARNDEWTVRYRLSDDGHLDFLALHDTRAPLHGEIRSDGSVATYETYLDHYVYNPSRHADEREAEEEMEAHNRAVTEMLSRKGLI